LALAVSALALAACGSGSGSSGESDSGSTTGGSTGAATTTDAAVVTDAKAAVEAGYEGTFQTPPTDGPAAQQGKKVWAVACIAAAPGCQTPVEAFKAAGQVLGWDVTLADGKADPAVYNSVIQQAIAAKADGIALMSIDCPSVKNSLTAAKQAGIPVVTMYSFDCDDPKLGGNEKLFDSTTPSPTGEFFSAGGDLGAQWIIAKTDGKAKIVYVTADTYNNAAYIRDAFHKRLETCAGCEIVSEINAPTGDNASGALVQKVETAMQQHPDTNVLALWADTKTVVLAQTIKKLKAEHPDLIVMGGEGNPENMPLIADGVQDVAIGVPMKWLGWAAADALNRIFAGEQPVAESLGYQIIDKDHGLPADASAWVPSVDYEAAYTKVWTGQ